MQHNYEDRELARREQELAPLAALAALAAALVIPGGFIYGQFALGDAPVDNNPALLRFVAENGTNFIAASIVRAIGFALLALVAYYLYIVTKRRKPDLVKVVLVFGVAGPLLFAVVSVAQTIFVVAEANAYADLATQTIERAKDILEGGTSQLVAAFGAAATLAFSLWLVMGSLYAMRVGLLTKAVGIVGIVIGAASVLGASFTPMILALWLLALAALFFGVWPGGRPPAWDSGTAIPWLSMKERAIQSAAEQQTDE